MEDADLFGDPILPPEGARRYELRDSLGLGGMGEVFRAWDRDMDREVALKVIRAIHGDSRKVMRRFRREVQTLALVDHPSVVRIYDFHEEQGLSFYTMELVEGQSLSTRLLDGPLDGEALLDMGRSLAEGLAAAHEAGIVHRDIKPANVFLRRTGQPVLLDFGLAKLTDRETVTALTQTGEMVGTLRYLPPEMLYDGKVERPGDIFQLGLVLWQSLTGRVPHEGEDGSTIIAHLARPNFPPPSRIRPELDEVYDELILATLDRDPAKRPDATALARGLETLRQQLDEPPASRRSGARPVLSSTMLGPSLSPWRQRSRALGGLLLGGLLLVLLSLALGKGQRSPSLPAPGSSWPGSSSTGFPSSASPSPGSSLLDRSSLELAEARLEDLDRLRLRFRAAHEGIMELQFQAEGGDPPLPSRHRLDLSTLRPISRRVSGIDIPLVPPLLRKATLSCTMDGAVVASCPLDPSTLTNRLLGPVDRLKGRRLEELMGRVAKIRKFLDQARGRSNYAARLREKKDELARQLKDFGLDESHCDRLRRFLPSLLGTWNHSTSPLGLRLLPLRYLETMLCNREGLESPWGWSCEVLGIRFDGMSEFPLLPDYREVARRSLIHATPDGLERWLWMAEPVFLDRQRVSFTAALFNFRKIVPEILRMKEIYDPEESLPSTVEDVVTETVISLEIFDGGGPWPPRKAYLDLGLRIFDRPYQVTARLNEAPAFVILNTCQIPRTDPSLVRSTLRPLVIGHPIDPTHLRRGSNRLELSASVIPGKEALHPFSLWGARIVVRP